MVSLSFGTEVMFPGCVKLCSLPQILWTGDTWDNLLYNRGLDKDLNPTKSKIPTIFLVRILLNSY
jgi:hypothetical protein